MGLPQLPYITLVVILWQEGYVGVAFDLSYREGVFEESE